MGFDPGVLGTIFAIGGLTSLGGAFVAGNTRWAGGFGRSMIVAAFIRSAGGLFTPFVTTASVFGAGLLVATQVVTDPAWTYYDINDTSLRQAITPARVQGRMNASIRFIGFGAMLPGTAAGALLGEFVGLREALF
ncbi:MAG: hypothetical protein ACR2NO_10625, partial [Chloroflexota bacterium]